MVPKVNVSPPRACLGNFKKPLQKLAEVYLSVFYPSFGLCIYLSMCLFVCLCVCLFVCMQNVKRLIHEKQVSQCVCLFACYRVVVVFFSFCASVFAFVRFSGCLMDPWFLFDDYYFSQSWRQKTPKQWLARKIRVSDGVDCLGRTKHSLRSGAWL